MMSPVNRRDFLAATGATLAAASIQRAVFAAGSDGKPSSAQRLHKAVKLSMVGGSGSVTDKFKLVKDAGFGGIDIDHHLDQGDVRRAKEDGRAEWDAYVKAREDARKRKRPKRASR